MKTYKFIVINKNNMTKLQHFATADRVTDYLLTCRVTENIIVLINEQTILSLKDVPTNDLRTIERILEEKANTPLS